MDYTKYTYKILCEDKRHYNFVRSYLNKKNVNNRKISNIAGLSEGKGDAKKFIDNNYKEALCQIRNNQNDILIVVRDADKADEQSIQDLITKYKCENDKKVFAVITNRNIETWFYFIDNQNSTASIDENTDKKDKYPKNGTKDTEYGKKLVDIVNNVKNTISYEFMPNSLCEMIKLLIKAENNC